MSEVMASLQHFRPEVALTVALLLVVVVDAIGAAWRNVVLLALTGVGLVAALALAVADRHFSGELFQGMAVADPMGSFFKGLLIGASLLVAVAFNFWNSRELRGLGQGEFYALLLAVTLSNLLLATANDLAMLYLALEMVSITSYVMVAYLKGDRLSNEASLKYILFGAVSTGTMLYGLTLLYGLTGTTKLPEIGAALATAVTDETRFAAYAITFLVLAGFGFKTAVVPFHFWCPDVYQGAPTPVTAFLSVAPKAAGFAVMARFFFQGLATGTPGMWDQAATIEWPQVLMVISALTMTVGNVAALTQTNMKRLLAYSSIAHAGYIMMGVVAFSENGARAMMIYLLAYLFMNLGAFLVVTLVHAHDGTFDLRDYPGLYRRAPFLTLAMAIFLFSLMGIPPLVGFMGKLYVFAAVIEKGPGYYWYAVVGAVNAAIAAYYYVRVLKTMIIDQPAEEKPALSLSLFDGLAVAAFLAANVLPLLFWARIEAFARAATALYAAR
ncbi:MAG TPA: NADH-quinone oxidoreductase subunit N [Vicinamibacteria bacterium]